VPGSVTACVCVAPEWVGGPGLPRQAEIQNLDLSIVEHKHVVRFEIAMDQTLPVCRAQPARNLNRDLDSLPDRKRAAAQPLAQ
jgi:hypothetical protein